MEKVVLFIHWNWNDDHGGFRIRAFLDNANAHIDNITVHEGRCADKLGLVQRDGRWVDR